MKVPKVTFLIFVSGKIVVTGAKSEKTIIEGFNNIYKIVQKYKKGKVKIWKDQIEWKSSKIYI